MSIRDWSAIELSERIRRGEIGVREALDEVFAVMDQKEGTLGCFITVDREGAYAKAVALQERIRKGEETGTLAGVPMAVKDNLCTKGLRTTCGSRMLSDFVPPYHATCVKNIENAGAIILGKTNLDEFAMGNSTETSYFGVTKNPLNENHSPGGSSGGSAASVAAGECFAALGTDTGGSVRQPASHCGVVGMKPTYGTVSRYGLIAYCSSMDQVGPIAKDVRDCAAILEVLSSWDPKDATARRRRNTGFAASLEEGVKGMKIGIPRDYFGGRLQDEVGQAVMEAARVLERQGAILEEVDLGLVEYAIPAYYTIACGEASSNLERYDGIKYGFHVDGGDLVSSYCKTRTEGFGKEVKRRILLGTFVLSEGYYDAYYLKALKVRRLIKNEFDKAFSHHDLILGPVAPTTAPCLGKTVEDPLQSYLSDIYTVPANLAGLPSISIPFGFDKSGLPIGVQLMGRAFGERDVFRAARACEKARRGE